jgi:hypothetical protein
MHTRHVSQAHETRVEFRRALERVQGSGFRPRPGRGRHREVGLEGAEDAVEQRPAREDAWKAVHAHAQLRASRAGLRERRRVLSPCALPRGVSCQRRCAGTALGG